MVTFGAMQPSGEICPDSRAMGRRKAVRVNAAHVRFPSVVAI